MAAAATAWEPFAPLLPFLYPMLHRTPRLLPTRQFRRLHQSARCTTAETQLPPDTEPTFDPHLNPSPFDYSHNPFADRCSLLVHSGGGGHGCVSFLREKYIEHGPPNGGDGGSGGNVYIQAIASETSLHRLVKRRELRAGRGRNGKGKNQGGERGDDVLFTVPVGTVVRELWRHDPVENERVRVLAERARVRALKAEHKAEQKAREQAREQAADADADADADAAVAADDAHEDEYVDTAMPSWKRDRWIAYPGIKSNELKYHTPPTPPRRRTTTQQALQPTAPIRLDLDAPMERPILLAAGASGGVGNPHFITPDMPRPKFATRGEPGMSIALALELKMLADVGLVGLPNAGKSTLLRSLSASRTRVGNWAFTTLQPVVGTVVLDNQKGRPRVHAVDEFGQQRSSFTIADIPGLIEDAHLDKGLGLGFLRHVERAKVLAFVVDLSKGDAVGALQSLWREVGEYERMRSQQINEESEARVPVEGDGPWLEGETKLEPLVLPPVSAKPWFVVATKADLPDTRAEFEALRDYLQRLREGEVPHPSGTANGWKKGVRALPISAIRGEGVDGIPGLVVSLLEM